eukprot:NODE_301_length_10368_cov_0.471614.p6 type:complete len:243 gc:universal NODE_301_length_10368_cov_0.471614:8678-9406(+)
MKLMAFEKSGKIFNSKLYYLLDNDQICVGVLIHVYKDKIFIDKVDSTKFAKKYFTSFLLVTILKSEMQDRRLYLSSKPSEYLFHDPARVILNPQGLINWWINFFSKLNATGSFYVPNEIKTSYKLPSGIDFHAFPRYDFKSDGIDDPSKNWDEMTEYVGCFSLRINIKDQIALNYISLSSSKFSGLIDKVRQNPSIKSSTFEFKKFELQGFDNFVNDRVSVKRKFDTAYDLSNLVKRKKKTI